MNEDKIEQAGTTPLAPVLELIDHIVQAKDNDDKTEYAKLLGKMPATFGIYPFFSTGPSPDAKNSDHSLCSLSQGGLGLPDRDYYFDDDKQEKRDAYLQHIANMLSLLDELSSSASAAQKVYDVELRLAEAHMTRTECRDPEATYNKMSVADLTDRKKGAFDFGAYLLGSTNKSEEDLGDINVRNVGALERAAEVASSIDSNSLSYYLKWRAVSSFAPYLSKAFVDENFDFFERTLSGTQEMKPRWKRAMAFTESALGEALGQIYCAAYFNEECKTRAVAIVEAVRQALEDRLKEVEWMTSDSTREEALKKMSRFRVKIGYPNKWIDYSTLDIQDGEDFLPMVLTARAFEHARETKEMNAPTDREKWVSCWFHMSHCCSRSLSLLLLTSHISLPSGLSNSL